MNNRYNELKETLEIEYDLTIELVCMLLNDYKLNLLSFNECINIAKQNDSLKD